MRVGLAPAAFLLLALVAAGCGGATRSSSPPARRPPASAPPPTGLGVDVRPWRTDFSKHTVPLSEIESGGPGKDGIPAIDRPRFRPARVIDWLEAAEPVIELELGGDARAYPLQIMVWHEIVNDRVAGVPVAVTFCPLCNTAIVFDRRLEGRTLSFGTTGNLRNSDLVMYDRQTESWWQQLGGEAVVGSYAGRRLRTVPARMVSFASFRTRHPNGRVLTRATGYARPYGQNPYIGYDDVGSPPFFPVTNADDKRLAPKERVVFVELGGEAVAVPFSALRTRRLLRIEAGGRTLLVRRVGSALSPFSGRDVLTTEVRDGDGKLVPFHEPFWFAVAAFRPDVRIVRG